MLLTCFMVGMMRSHDRWIFALNCLVVLWRASFTISCFVVVCSALFQCIKTKKRRIMRLTSRSTLISGCLCCGPVNGVHINKPNVQHIILDCRG
uniref:Uncharacterized protein n=1 Tax=Anopheles darlingi TaxID=43151 RepID=A0A2M4D9U6_ANODA